MEQSNYSSSRRGFLKTSLIGGTLLGMAPIISASNTMEKIENIDIMFTSKMPKGQKTVVGLTAKPLNKVRIGFVGLGSRGYSALLRYPHIEGVEIKALCDILPERVQMCQKLLKEKGVAEAIEYSGNEESWKEMVKREDLDLIYVCTPWSNHTSIGVFAMNHGKHVAIEVPCALTVAECWELVNTSEKTRQHCMMLENCCYDFFEMTTLSMAQQGVFGEIIHAEGAYIHNLAETLFTDGPNNVNFWRRKYNEKHTGNPYPTHGLGPVAQIMNINRGDRFTVLSSMSTNSQLGMKAFANEKYGKNSFEANLKIKLGDMNTSMLQTANGKTVMIQHDITSPRPYSRIHLISGTKGIAQKYPMIHAAGIESSLEISEGGALPVGIALEPNPHEWLKPEELAKLVEKYKHPITRQYGEMAKQVGGHGGMDFIMDSRLIYCLRKGLPLDQSVYDGVTWSSIVELSEKSVLSGSKPIEVPDFTRGEWKNTPALSFAM
jgi:predicted dehydrogenase